MMRCWLAGLVLISIAVAASGDWTTVTVDPGADDQSCSSLSDQQLNVDTNGSISSSSSSLCSTLTRAVGGGDSCDQGLQGLDRTLIRLADGNHTLTACIIIAQSQNLRFEAVNEGNATIMCSGEDSGIYYDNLFFTNSQNISFSGIAFEGCGPISSNVFFNRSQLISFENCIFRGNTGSSLQFRFSTGIRLTGCTFVNNINALTTAPDTENTTITDIYDTISTSGALTLFTRNTSLHLTISSCRFTANQGSRNPPGNTRPVLLKTHGHGGAILLRLVESQASYVVVEDSVFEGNVAEVDGGAIYLSLSERSADNVVVVRNSNFSGNVVAEASGGAVSISSFNLTSNNSLQLQGCRFSSNSGNSGGAVSLALYNSGGLETELLDAMSLRACHFEGNRATNEGTAVGLFSLVHVDQVGFPVTFQDCTFLNNTSEGSEDSSAIASFRFPTIFEGENRFEGNVGGGITLLNTRMRVEASSNITFLRNTAVFGAGIAMDDRCLLEVSSNVSMLFEENVAMESGGGIYVEFPPIRFVVDIFNRLCFLQYNDGSGVDTPPHLWRNTSIVFNRNRARLSGAAIFASDMQQCAWLGSDFTGNDTLIFAPPDALDTPDYPFQYSGNTLFPEGMDVTVVNNSNLATSPATIHAVAPHTCVQPGEVLRIDLLAMDQVQNSREAIWSVEAPAAPPNLDALSATNTTYPYTIPSAENLPGVTILQENFTSSFTLNFSLLRTLGTVQPLELNVSGCHPGYQLNPVSMNCECNADNDTNILRCDENSRYLYLREGTWGGHHEEEGVRRLITATVQPGYVKCDPQGRLPGCRFKFDDENAQCREGREGPLCGTCSTNYSVTLDLTDCSPRSCWYGRGLFIALCVLVLLLSTLILLFNVALANELKGVFFYAQVVGLVLRPYVIAQTDISQLTSVVRILVNLFNLSVPIPFCLSASLRAHYVALLGFATPFLIIISVILFALGTRFIRRLGRHSALKGITFLSLFFYKYIADTAFVLISCIDTPVGFVFQYDGSQSCTAPEFVVFFVIGLLLVIFFVALAPLVVSYISVRRPQRFQQYADVLTKGLRLKHHWWGGWDIWRRLPFVFVGFFINLRPSLALFLMSLAALGVLLVHLFTKPFEKMYINVIEALVLLNLLMVTVAFLDPANPSVPFEFSIVLLLLPYLYAIIYLIYSLTWKIWKQAKKQHMERTLSMAASAAGDEATPTATPTGGDGVGGARDGSMAQSTSSQKASLSVQEPSSEIRPRSSAVVGRVTEEEADFTNFREPLLDDN